MVGLNLLAVGAAPEAHLGDAPANAAPPSEGTDFAGVLEVMLPADALPASEESASPNADALGAQMATLGLPLLTLLPVQTPAVADRAVEPSLEPAPSADAPTLYAPTTLRGYAPEPAPALGAGMGDGDFTHTLTEASENLLAVEGDAPPAAARQAEPPLSTALHDSVDGHFGVGRAVHCACAGRAASRRPRADARAVAPARGATDACARARAAHARAHAANTRPRAVARDDAGRARSRSTRCCAELERRRAGRAAHRAHGLRTRAQQPHGAP
jgi:hypothetical protein